MVVVKEGLGGGDHSSGHRDGGDTRDPRGDETGLNRHEPAMKNRQLCLKLKLKELTAQQ